jgi:macrodomain Ter protein organizer (MatP/YcbG family)
MQRKWKVTPGNRYEVVDYIKRKFDDHTFWDHRSFADQYAAEQAYKELILNKMTSDSIQAFLDAHFDPMQIQKLRTALRVRRSRKNTRKRSIELSGDLYDRLRFAAVADGVTLSQLIDTLLRERESRNPSLFS